MPILDSTFRTVTCNACNKTVTYEQNQRDQEFMKKVMEDNPWLRSNRVVLTADGRNFSYCSDMCMLAGVESGLFNMPEPAKVEIPTGSATAQIAAAAAAAKRQAEAQTAIKTGAPVTLHTT